MSRLLSAPWFLAVLALLLMVGTQFAALKMYWYELFPGGPTVTLVKRGDPSPIHWSFSSDEIVQMRDELEERLMAVKEREAELNRFESRLEADRIEVEAIKESVEVMRDGLLDDIVTLEEAEGRNLKNLAKTYSGLEPAATVSIFKELDDETVVKILFFMKPETVGTVLQEMATQEQGRGAGLVKRAAKLSDMLRLFNDETRKA